MSERNIATPKAVLRATQEKLEKLKIKTLEEFLSSAKVETCLDGLKKGIIQVSDNDTVENAFKLMAEHNILSLPVWSTRRARFVAFVDILDIMCHALDVLDTKGDTEALNKAFLSAKVTSIQDLSERNPFNALGGEAPLRVALKAITKRSVKRLPIIDGAGEMVTLLTESAVVRHIFAFMDSDKIGAEVISKIKLGYKEVACVSSTAPVVDGFKLMREKRISALPVVDAQGKVIDNLSATDIKSMITSSKLFDNLKLTVAEFLKLKAANPKITGVVHVKESDTILTLCTKFTNTGVHRIYVFGDGDKLVGVVSLTDLLKHVSTVYSI